MSFKGRGGGGGGRIQQCSNYRSIGRVSTVFLIPTVGQLMPWSASHSWSCGRGSSTYPKWLNTALPKRFKLLQKKKQTQNYLLQQTDACRHIQITALQTGVTVGSIPLISPFLQLVCLSSSPILPQMSTFSCSELFAKSIHGKIVASFSFILQYLDFGGSTG